MPICIQNLRSLATAHSLNINTLELMPKEFRPKCIIIFVIRPFFNEKCLIELPSQIASLRNAYHYYKDKSRTNIGKNRMVVS